MDDLFFFGILVFYKLLGISLIFKLGSRILSEASSQNCVASIRKGFPRGQRLLKIFTAFAVDLRSLSKKDTAHKLYYFQVYKFTFTLLKALAQVIVFRSQFGQLSFCLQSDFHGGLAGV